MIALTTSRVSQNTDESVNERIRCETIDSISRCVTRGWDAIDRRLAELDAEWDIERMLETMAPTITLTGLFLGLTSSRRWLALPLVVNAFFLQHAIQGWCPPLGVLRRLGFRTADEIDRERYALKALRGDFRSVPLPDRGEAGMVEHAMAAVDR